MISISVIIPCHNAEAYLSRALSSVLAQSVSVDQVIIVLDRCADRSCDVAGSFPGVILEETDLGNGGLARNVGVSLATGDWVAFLDADDWWLPDHVANLVGLVGGHSDTVGCLNAYGRYSHEGQSQGPIRVPEADASALSDIGYRVYPQHYKRVGFFMGMSACSVRRDRFLEIGGFAEEMVRRHDIEMWIRLIHGQRWAWDPRVSSAYQVDTPGSISSSLAPREWYAYRAWERNLDIWGQDDAAYVEQVRAAARRAVMAAITDGTAQDRRKARELLRWLTGGTRAVGELGMRLPGVVGWANRLRRQRALKRAGVE
ncbi:MAG: glycosyltransferase family A protein [Pseudomonadota bacterium]